MLARGQTSISGPDVTRVDVSVLAADGFPLAARVFEPAGHARGVALITAGTAIPQAFYRRFAHYLAQGGLRTVTFDYRGIGGSRPASLRGLRGNMTDWAQLDARGVLAWARHRWPGPLVLVGHSFGAQLVGLVDELADVDGALFVGAQMGYVGHWPALARLRLSLLSRVLVPSLTALFGYLPGEAGMGEDLPAGVAREWARWCRHPEYLVGYHLDAADRYARFSRPTLSYSFTDDEYAPEPAVTHFLGLLTSAPVEHRRVAPMDLGTDRIGHFDFFRSRFAPTLWREASAFLDDVIAGREPRLRPLALGLFDVGDEDIARDLAFGR